MKAVCATLMTAALTVAPLQSGLLAQAPAPTTLQGEMKLDDTVIGAIATSESDAMATTSTAPSTPLAQRLDAIFDDQKWENARWGVIVEDMQSKEVLYERDAEKSFMPASNMKLFTTAAALATLGADFTFETKIYATGTTDSQGTLHGNIYIVGSGDPSISGRYLEDKPTTAILAEWADAITSMGIKRIEGDIVGDDDIFDDRPIAGSWAYDYLQEWYAAENSGLAINDNCWDIIVAPQPSIARQPQAAKSDDIRLSVGAENPLKTKYYSVSVDEVKAVPDNDNNTTGGREEEAEFSIERRPDSNEIILSGTIEEDSAPVHEWGSIHNGTLFTVTLLEEELERRRIRVSGKPVDIDDMDKQLADHIKANPGALVHTHVSPPLHKLLAIVNKPSQNFYADMLLKATGAHVHGKGSWSTGESVVKDLLTTAGANPKSLNMSDGSGLSRYNMIEPRQALALLKYMHSRPDFATFEASLPIMGVDGTLRTRMRGTPAQGNVKAKTGTIGRVRALSGFLMTNSGRRLVFSMIANNYSTPTDDATEAQNQALLEIMKQY